MSGTNDWVTAKPVTSAKVSGITSQTFRKVVIEVTEEDVANGTWGVVGDPISLAAKRVLGANSVAVGFGYATSYKGDRKTYWIIEPVALVIRFLNNFRDKKPVLTPAFFDFIFEQEVSVNPPPMKRKPRLNRGSTYS